MKEELLIYVCIYIYFFFISYTWRSKICKLAGISQEFNICTRAQYKHKTHNVF